MVSVSDLYAAAGRAGLLIPATIGGAEVLVDFRAPDVEVLDGLGLSSDFAIRYPAEDVVLDTGHELVIGGVTYLSYQSRRWHRVRSGLSQGG